MTDSPFIPGSPFVPRGPGVPGSPVEFQAYVY